MIGHASLARGDRRLRVLITAAIGCLVSMTGAALAQGSAPTILEPGYLVTAVPECGFGFNGGVQTPLGPGNFHGAACTPGGPWGNYLLLSVSTPWDDDGAYVEKIDFSGHASGYLGTSGRVYPTSLAFSPLGWRGGDLLFVDIYGFASLDPFTRMEKYTPAGSSGIVGTLGTVGAAAVDPSGDFGYDLFYNAWTWPDYVSLGVIRQDAAGNNTVFSSTGGVGHFGPGGAWGTGLYDDGEVLHPDGSITSFPGGFAFRDLFDFVPGLGFGGDMFSVCFNGNDRAVCRVKPDGSRTVFTTSWARVAACGGSLWLLEPGNCWRITATSALATASISPTTLNVRGQGNDISFHATVTDAGTGAPLDASLMSPVWISKISSPTIGEVKLPTPNASPGCDDTTQDGIWENLSQRVVQGSGSATFRFTTPSDGRCATRDGNRQDVIALLLDEPDGETATVCATGTHPNSAIPVEACGAITVQNRGNR